MDHMLYLAHSPAALRFRALGVIWGLVSLLSNPGFLPGFSSASEDEVLSSRGCFWGILSVCLQHQRMGFPSLVGFLGLSRMDHAFF